MSQIVYHGSDWIGMHNTGFDLSKAGETAGQYFGHGIYFGRDINTAEHYRKVSNGVAELYSNGNLLSTDYINNLFKKPEENSIANRYFDHLKKSSLKGDEFNTLQSFLGKNPELVGNSSLVNVVSKLGIHEARKGETYEVSIPENRRLLNSNVPYSQQSKYIRETLAADLDGRFESLIKSDSLGSAFIRHFPTQKEASSELTAMGIHGAMHTDLTGANNVVMFSTQGISNIKPIGVPIKTPQDITTGEQEYRSTISGNTVDEKKLFKGNSVVNHFAAIDLAKGNLVDGNNGLEYSDVYQEPKNKYTVDRTSNSQTRSRSRDRLSSRYNSSQQRKVPPAPIPTPQSITTPVVKSNNNPFKNVFGFDIETTGVNEKTSNIWQLGLADRNTAGQEFHTNPFDNFNKSDGKTGLEFFEKLRTSNGVWSEKAAQAGNFNSAMTAFDNFMPTLDHSVKATIGSLKSDSIVLIQNMNFENKFITQAMKDGKISPSASQAIMANMENKAASLETGKPIVDVFQRPFAVQREMREAEFAFHAEFRRNQSPETFTRYTEHLNNAMSEYEKAAADPARKGVLAIDLMDISKIFYGNAAEQGLIDKRTAMLGLNIDFLSKALFDKAEDHTALSDSQRSIQIFDRLVPMIKDLQAGNKSQDVLDFVEKVKAQQPQEVNKKFLSGIRSVIEDFKESGTSGIAYGSNYYQPAVTVHNASTGQIDHLPKRVTGSGKESTSLLAEALDKVVDRYGMFKEDINGLNRKQLVQDVVDAHTDGFSYKDIHESLHGFEDGMNSAQKPEHLMTSSEMLEPISSTAKTDWDAPTSLFGKTMKKKTKYAILGAAAAGGAYMWAKPRPTPLPEQEPPVYENYYDEQYLGTAFVDFKERNKRYAY